jgi:hypothetical protein
MERVGLVLVACGAGCQPAADCPLPGWCPCVNLKVQMKPASAAREPTPTKGMSKYWISSPPAPRPPRSSPSALSVPCSSESRNLLNDRNRQDFISGSIRTRRLLATRAPDDHSQGSRAPLHYRWLIAPRSGFGGSSRGALIIAVSTACFMTRTHFIPIKSITLSASNTAAHRIRQSWLMTAFAAISGRAARSGPQTPKPASQSLYSTRGATNGATILPSTGLSFSR